WGSFPGKISSPHLFLCPINFSLSLSWVELSSRQRQAKAYRTFLVSSAEESCRIVFRSEFINIETEHRIGISIGFPGPLLGPPGTKQQRAKESANRQTTDQRYTRSLHNRDQNTQRRFSKFPRSLLVRKRVLAEPLHHLLILHLIDQLVRGFRARRVKNKHRIVADSAVGGGHRLPLRTELLELRFYPLIVIRCQRSSVEFNHDQLLWTVFGSSRFGSTRETHDVKNRLIAEGFLERLIVDGIQDL